MSRDISTYVCDLNLKQIHLASYVQHPAARRSEAVQITTLIVCYLSGAPQRVRGSYLIGHCQKNSYPSNNVYNRDSRCHKASLPIGSQQCAATSHCIDPLLQVCGSAEGSN